MLEVSHDLINKKMAREEKIRLVLPSDKKKKGKKRGTGAVPAAGGGVLNSPIAVGAGAAAIGGVTIWVLTRSSNPVSPATP